MTFFVRNKFGDRNNHRVDDLQLVRTQTGTCFRGFHNRIRQTRRFRFRRAPGKLHFRVHLVLFKIALGHVHKFGDDFFSFQVFHGFKWR